MHIHSNFLGFLINIIHNNLKQDEQNLTCKRNRLIISIKRPLHNEYSSCERPKRQSSINTLFIGYIP